MNLTQRTLALHTSPRSTTKSRPENAKPKDLTNPLKRPHTPLPLSARHPPAPAAKAAAAATRGRAAIPPRASRIVGQTVAGTTQSMRGPRSRQAISRRWTARGRGSPLRGLRRAGRRRRRHRRNSSSSSMSGTLSGLGRGSRDSVASRTAGVDVSAPCWKE